MIRVLHILSSAGIAGGERYLLDLVRFSQAGFRHDIVLPQRGPIEHLFKDVDVTFKIIDMRRQFSLSALYRLTRLAKKNAIDIIHTHGYRANFYGRLAGVAAVKKCIATVHVSLFDYLYTPMMKRYGYLLIEKVFAFKTKTFLCISEAMERDIHKLGIPKRKTRLIYNGVDMETFYPRPDQEVYKKRLGIAPEVNLIGTVGRMTPEKGQIYLIQAIGHLLDLDLNVRCLFVGEGPLQNWLMREAEKIGVDHLCEFMGRRLDVERIYPALDIFVLPSPREPFGLVLLEAMATGVPVIAADSGGPASFIQTDVNGVLVPPENPKALADKITDLLMNEKHRETMGKSGRETIEHRFNIRKTVSSIEDVYYSLAGRAMNGDK